MIYTSSFLPNLGLFILASSLLYPYKVCMYRLILCMMTGYFGENIGMHTFIPVKLCTCFIRMKLIFASCCQCLGYWLEFFTKVHFSL